MVRRLERIILAVLAALTAMGFELAVYDARLFRAYISESGPIENLTVAALIGGSFVCFRRIWRLRGQRSSLFLAATALLGALFLVAAGEELSWGQHVLGFKAPVFFQQYNAQREVNLHNMRVRGVKITQLIDTGIVIVAVASCSLLPVGYRMYPRVRRLTDALAIPVPQARHVVWLAVLAFAAWATPSKFGRGEVLELVTSTMLFLITAVPLNAAAFGEEADHHRESAGAPAVKGVRT
jgi:hypothetical protein